MGMRRVGTGAEETALPDWSFIYAREGDRLNAIDAMFGLPKGSARAVGRVHHPDPDRPYGGETVAVPVPGFAKQLGGSAMRSKR